MSGAQEGVVAGDEANLDRETDAGSARSAASSARRTASAAWRRGIAYSISVKRTRRSLAKTR